MKKKSTVLHLLVFMFIAQWTVGQSQEAILPISGLASENQDGFGIEKSFAGTGLTDHYHSLWGAGTTMPVTLTYYFDGLDKNQIDMMDYTPRTNTSTSGRFIEVDILFANVENPQDADFQMVKTHDFGGVETTTEVAFSQSLTSVTAIRLVVKSATPKPDGNKAVNVGEIRFFGKIENKIMPVSAEANQFQSGQEIEKSFEGTGDRDHYHSPWGSGTIMPVILTYNFENVDRMESLTYRTRDNDYSGHWGNFREVKIYYTNVQSPTDNDFSLVRTVDFKGRAGKQIVSLKDATYPDGLLNPTAIRLEVVSANLKCDYEWVIDEPVAPLDPNANPAANCGEMIFRGLYKGSSTNIDNQITKGNAISIYPNPVKSDLNLSVADKNINEISVYNMTGVKVMSLNGMDISSLSLNVTSLPTGRYFVQVKLQDQVLVKSFVKQ